MLASGEWTAAAQSLCCGQGKENNESSSHLRSLIKLNRSLSIEVNNPSNKPSILYYFTLLWMGFSVPMFQGLSDGHNFKHIETILKRRKACHIKGCFNKPYTWSKMHSPPCLLNYFLMVCIRESVKRCEFHSVLHHSNSFGLVTCKSAFVFW